jgi:hypothetical protein
VARRSRHRGRARPDVPAWPLDPSPGQGDQDGPPTAQALDRGQAPGATRPGVRVFFCKGCRRGVEATDPPDGWLRVQPRDAATQQRDGRTYLTVALFCGVPCLAAWAAATTEVTV